MKTTTFLLACLALSLCWRAEAWSGAGHQVVAAIAYRQLSGSDQRKVSAILKAHPEYSRWKKNYRSEDNHLDLETYVFMRASTWPDEIRRRDDPNNHPHWHYIDYPLKPRKFPLEPAPAPDDDALFAIGRSEEILGAKKTSDEDRAIYVSWLIHLVGDLHQPLHCSSLITPEHPNGDKGGNELYVKPGEAGISLHSFWDGLLGTSGKASTHWNRALSIAAEHPRKSLGELKRATTPRDWSLEGRSLAIDKAYLHGKLKTGDDRDSAKPLSERYIKNAKAAAEKQAALAGCRLADELHTYAR
jgi:hypothetical protein